jgi:hypothetical protein
MEEYEDRIRTAMADREWAQFQLDNADADLGDAVREALASGVRAEELAEPAGLTPRQIRHFGQSAG